MAKKKSKSKPKQQTEQKYNLQHTVAPEVINPEIITVKHGFVKLCRLCENKEGPFLNIFGGDKITAKKLEELMPFVIAENDELPHKICFRCSAKVEELYEFVQKCIKTQQNLHTAIGKKNPVMTKKKTEERLFWEEQLNKSNVSHDDICDAVVKRAVQSIIIGTNDINIPLDSEKSEKIEDSKNKEKHSFVLSDETNEDESIPLRNSRSRPVSVVENEKTTEIKIKESNSRDGSVSKHGKGKKDEIDKINFSFDYQPEVTPKEEKVPEKPFDIMDHVSTIKVKGVGVLYQCQLCNRNFLSKNILRSHRCAKTKQEVQPVAEVVEKIPDLPKPSTIKYINTSKPGQQPNKPIIIHDDNGVGKNDANTSPNTANVTLNSANAKLKKTKPKIGPASKMKAIAEESLIGTVVNPVIVNKGQVSTNTNVECSHKFIKGRNNTYTLVKEQPPLNQDTPEMSNLKKKNVEIDPSSVKKVKKRKQSVYESTPEVIRINDSPETASKSQPYPVGLFQTVSQFNSGSDSTQNPVIFSTTAAKKQSYTIVQTDNPSKLLISVKSRNHKQEKAPPPKIRKVNDSPGNNEPKSYSTYEDGNSFSFINVDPLLQPSYVLPTNSIQESQISTSKAYLTQSTPISDQYKCNMCGEKFNREQKLLTHIHSHYTKMDEVSHVKERSSKRRGKKSGN